MPSNQINRRTLLSMATLAFPMLRSTAFALGQSGRSYSRHAIDVVLSATVIDMLAPLTLDLSPDAYAKTLTPRHRADFKASGITGFHQSFGIGGPNARDEVMTFLAGWASYCGRYPETFALVRTVADLDAAKARRAVALP